MTYVFIVSHNNAREGAPRLCAKLALGLHRLRWFEKVFVCSLQQGASPEPGISVVKLDHLVIQVRSLLQKGKSVRLILSTVICTRIAQSLRKAIGVAASGDNFKIIGLVHEVRNETFSWVKPLDLSGLDRIAFVAEYTAHSYSPDFASGLDRTVIHNWLSAKEREMIDAIKEDRQKHIILCVGVVARHKGQLHLAKAFSKLRETFPEYRMAIVGHVYDKGYAAQIKDIDPAIEIVGPVEHSEVLEMMRSCEIFLHGSPMESCCLSIMEAMYCKCPIVATRVGGIPEEIHDGIDGLLYEFDNHEQCSSLLLKLASKVSLRNQLGSAARQSVIERFIEDDKLRAYRDILE